ncbi:tryptophanyl-tRNA synthetase [Tieghemostelium lacteum]|uniref:tryptophan--tRNA ligase n=1 Tax=Tieghemostelium lacteum TaxID=361077 RepID=A0A151Z7Y6_TIELA|nr:tryptophanyl-tRNA synthetase [Tieghemostelium lacteum]|eukprot:KYQ90083.1 tryptophanyl-tRNA synthetase [Tieghemostelium lacteum]
MLKNTTAIIGRLQCYNRYYTINTVAQKSPQINTFIQPIISLEDIDFKQKNGIRIFSGMQPTGDGLHLGNYLGAMSNWLKIQDLASLNTNNSVLFSIVDSHSLTATSTISPEKLRNNTINVAIQYLACGIDPSKVILFNQSMVPAHSELLWILNCITPFSKLTQMIQYKEKSKASQVVTNGLLSYPVLMASDILLYKSTHVPVGEDQTQHLELTRELVDRFHKQYCVNGKTDYFPIPKTVISKLNKKIMSLNDGSVKMSKSNPQENSRINLSDSDKEIQSKIKKSKTDSIMGISYDPENRPDISNLLSILSSCTDRHIDDLVKEFHDKSNSVFKDYLSQSLIKKISPIREQINYYQSNPKQVQDILYQGAASANAIANKNLKEIKDLVGLFN